MSYIYTIRHGQPTLGFESYDNLSDQGLVQSECLGKYLCSRDIVFDAVYTGTLNRHDQTAERVAQVYREAGKSFPESIIHPGFDEIDFVDIMQKLTPMIEKEDREFVPLQTQAMNAFREETPDRVKLFERVYVTIFKAWTQNRYPGAVEPTWEEYCKRVISTIDVLRDHGEEKRIAAFTSGTPMGILIQESLKLDMKSMMRIVAVLYHTNVTTFHLRENGLVLESMNIIAHLPEGEATNR